MIITGNIAICDEQIRQDARNAGGIQLGNFTIAPNSIAVRGGVTGVGTESRLASIPQSRKEAKGLLLTYDEAAAILHPQATASAVRKLAKNGQLEYRKVGRKEFVTRQSVENYCRCQENENHRDSTRGKMTAQSSSSMEDGRYAQDSLKIVTSKLKKRS